MRDNFGVKDVMDVEFIALTGEKAGRPVLRLDMCTLTQLDTTAEVSEARGGRGNAIAVSWNYNREVTFNITNALISDDMLEVILGQAKVEGGRFDSYAAIETSESSTELPLRIKPINASEVKIYAFDGTLVGNGSSYDEQKQVLITSGLEANRPYVAVYPIEVEKTFTLSADKFPGTYEIVGVSIVRGDDDEDYEMVMHIPRAKIQTGFTLSLDAEGDPSTFDMAIQVQKPASGDMVYLAMMDD